MDGIHVRQVLDESFNLAYSIPGKAHLKEEVGNAVTSLGEYPIEQVYRLIGFLEGRRSKQLELFVVLCAAIVGGIVGGLATWFLGGPPAVAQ